MNGQGPNNATMIYQTTDILPSWAGQACRTDNAPVLPSSFKLSAQGRALQGWVRWGRAGHPAGTWPGSDYSSSLSRLVGVGGHGDGGRGGEGEDEMERARVSDEEGRE